jgi:hypothetical protein
MRKLVTLTALIIITATTFGQYKVGGGLTLGTEIDFGLNLRGDYEINENITVAPGFTLFFPDSPEGTKVTNWQLGADVHYYFHEMDDFKFYGIHYYFHEMDDFKFYGIGGLNYSYKKIKTDAYTYTDPFFGTKITYPETTVSDGEIGLDLGGGANYKQFFGELKYDTGFDQLTISVGMYFDL